MANEYRFSFRYTAYVSQSAYRALLWRTQGTILVLSAIVLVWALVNLGSPTYAPVAGFGTGVVFVFWAAWLGGYRRAALAATASGEPEVTVILGEEACLLQSAEVDSTVRWPAISRVYRLRSAWILRRKGLVISTVIPADCLTAEMRALIERKVRESGGVVS